MDDAYIRFINGTSIRVRAREFDISLERASQEDKPKRFTYKDRNGRETPIYLRMDQVAAIIVAPAAAGQPTAAPAAGPTRVLSIRHR